MIPNGTTFPDLYAQLNTGKLLEVFDQGPARLRNVLVDLTHEHLQANPRPGKWSIQEIVLHVADSEIMGAARIRQAYLMLYSREADAEEIKLGESFLSDWDGTPPKQKKGHGPRPPAQSSKRISQ